MVLLPLHWICERATFRRIRFSSGYWIVRFLGNGCVMTSDIFWNTPEEKGS